MAQPASADRHGQAAAEPGSVGYETTARGIVLRDLLTPHLLLVVCGSAAGRRSAELGHYYAGRGNKFWATLAAIGLTPRQLAPAEYEKLLSFGIGLTDVVKGQAGSDAEVDFARSDPRELARKLEQFSPRYLCFNGKRAARVFLGRTGVEFGLQAETAASTSIFVAPSTSGAANGYWDVDLWHELARLVKATA
jgi:TDG/mug DNA glycosylase family protein